MFYLSIILSVGYVCTPGKCVDRTNLETSYPLTTCQANPKCHAYDWNGSVGHLCNTTRFVQSTVFVACKLATRPRRNLLTIAEPLQINDNVHHHLQGWDYIVIATGAMYIVIFGTRCCQQETKIRIQQKYNPPDSAIHF